MPDLYNAWAEQGIHFHYVSSSPWQLFSALEDFVRLPNFHVAASTCEHSGCGTTVLRRLMLFRRKGKGAEIRSILRRFPNRNFILVGDSGERDPEIYGGIARRFPHQVQTIYIRQLGSRPLGEARIEKAFRGLDDSKLRTFDSPLEIGEQLLAEA